MMKSSQGIDESKIPMATKNTPTTIMANFTGKREKTQDIIGNKVKVKLSSGTNLPHHYACNSIEVSFESRITTNTCQLLIIRNSLWQGKLWTQLWTWDRGTAI